MIPQMLTILLGLILIAASVRQLMELGEEELPVILAWFGLSVVGFILIAAGCIPRLWT